MATPKSSNGKTPSNGAGKKPAKSNAAKSLHELFEDQLKDIYWAEKALTKALPKMIKNATSTELKSAFTDHLDVTEGQVARCEEVFESIGKKATASKCEAMEGLIKEAEEMIESTEPGSVRDAGLICAAQKVEHYEIATYGTLVAWANQLGESGAATLLEETLNEEKEADVTLTGIAEAYVNEEAEDTEDEDDEITPTMTKSKRTK